LIFLKKFKLRELKVLMRQGGEMWRLEHVIIYITLGCFCIFAFNHNCWAEISQVHASKDYKDQWNNIQLKLETQIIQQRLLDYGLSSMDVDALFQKLSPKDIHKLSINIEQLVPAGNIVYVAALVFLITLVVLAMWIFSTDSQ